MKQSSPVLRLTHLTPLFIFCAVMYGCVTTGGSKKSATAPAYRCVAVAEGPKDFKVRVAGWGNTGGEAASNARENALYLSDGHRLIDGWTLLIGGSANRKALDENNTRMLEALETQFLKSPTEKEPLESLEVPGYSVDVLECNAVVTPIKPRDNQSWAVTWAGHSTSGHDLGATIERARRQACGKAYSKDFISIFDHTKPAVPAKKVETVRAGVEMAHDNLSQCMRAENKMKLGASELKQAWPPQTSSSQPVLCTGYPPAVSQKDPTPTTPTGIGLSPESAQEAAWRGYRWTLQRGILGSAMLIAASAPSDYRGSLILAELERFLVESVRPGLFETMSTWCGTLADPAKKPTWEWNRIDGACPVVPALSSETDSSSPPTLERLNMVRSDFCNQQIWSEHKAFTETRPTIPETMRVQSDMSYLGKRYYCEMNCLNKSRTSQFEELPPVTFKDEKATMDALKRAIANQDADLFLGLVPTFATAQMMRVLKMQPTGFWQGLAKVQAQGKLNTMFKVKQVRGRWTIAFVGRM